MYYFLHFLLFLLTGFITPRTVYLLADVVC